MAVFTWTRITFRKTFQNEIRPFPDLKAWFLPMWTQSCFKSRFWHAFWNAKNRAFWIVIHIESLILGHVNAFSSFGTWFVCVHFGMRAEAMHGSISADCAVGTKYYLAVRRSWSWLGRRFAMHVNACSSNHDPNHVLDRDLKRLSERDSFSCEHSQCQIRILTM